MVLKEVAFLLALEFVQAKCPVKGVQVAEAMVVQKIGVAKGLVVHAFVFQSQVLRWSVMVLRRWELKVMDGQLLREVVE